MRSGRSQVYHRAAPTPTGRKHVEPDLSHQDTPRLLGTPQPRHELSDNKSHRPRVGPQNVLDGGHRPIHERSQFRKSHHERSHHERSHLKKSHHERSHHERSHLEKSHHERSHHERSERQLLRIKKRSVSVESKTKQLIQKMILSISDLVVDLCEAGRAEHGQTSGGIRGLKPSYRIPRVCGEQAEPKGGRNNEPEGDRRKEKELGGAGIGRQRR